MWIEPVVMAAMGEVHQLILREGLEAARGKAGTRAERQAVEAEPDPNCCFTMTREMGVEF